MFLHAAFDSFPKMLTKIQRLLHWQHGFTLIEMVTTLALLGVLLAMATGSMTYYFSSKALEAAARELTSEIREAQALAVATGNSHRIDFSDSDSYTLMRQQGSAWTARRGAKQLPSGVEFDAVSPPNFGGDRYQDFYARGSAEGGQIVLKGRYGKTKTLQVDGETVNVH